MVLLHGAGLLVWITCSAGPQPAQKRSVGVTVWRADVPERTIDFRVSHISSHQLCDFRQTDWPAWTSESSSGTHLS